MASTKKPKSKNLQASDASPGRDLAKVTMSPLMRHAHLASTFGGKYFGGVAPALDAVDVLADDMARSRRGNRSFASDMLTAQASTLDAVFCELLRRAQANMGVHPEAADRYMRLALKAQANCRATLEALARLHQPREQIVKHVHLNNNGHAIVAEEFHHHTGDQENGKTADLPRESGPNDGARRAALPSSEPSGQPMPMCGDEGKETVPVAWGGQHRPA